MHVSHWIVPRLIVTGGCCAEVIVCERGGEVFIYVSDYFDCVGGVV